MNIWNLPRTEVEAVRLFQEKGIIAKNKICANGHPMKIYFGARIFWKCRICNSKISVRQGNWLSDSRIDFVTIVRFIYGWCWERSSLKWCQHELGVANNFVIDWNNYMREVCVHSLLNREHKMIGGEGMIVEIDESLFTKRKNNTGRVLPQQWVFGGICRETNDCFIVEVPNRSASTLFPAIVENIKVGTTIYSDSWRGYITSELENAGLHHFKVNHRYNFVDETTGVHTQNIERLWGSAKWRNKRHRGTARNHLYSYLAEFMWRKQQPNEVDKFDAIMSAIADYMPPK